MLLTRLSAFSSLSLTIVCYILSFFKVIVRFPEEGGDAEETMLHVNFFFLSLSLSLSFSLFLSGSLKDAADNGPNDDIQDDNLGLRG